MFDEIKCDYYVIYKCMITVKKVIGVYTYENYEYRCLSTLLQGDDVTNRWFTPDIAHECGGGPGAWGAG